MTPYELLRFELQSVSLNAPIALPNSPVNAHNELKALLTLLALMQGKLAASIENEPPESWASDPEQRRLVGVYRNGQQNILTRHIEGAIRDLQSFVVKTVTEGRTPPSSAEEFGPEVLDRLIFSESSLSEEFVDQLEEIDDEWKDGMDEDTYLTLALIRERHLDGSPWREFLDAQNMTLAEVEQILGDGLEDVKEHFTNTVRPALDSAPKARRLPANVYNWENFAWAAALMETNGLDVPEAVSVSSGFGISFGIVMA
ncbi:hypothetical protein HDV00_004730 [Rhizophlyctis rosea]|nr:hypothetical protein HDV00_004730 [Rhizophlyctis rosea]